MKQEDTIDFHIKRTWQAIAKMYNEWASTYGATMATGFVLLNIDKVNGTPSTSLGPKMGMEATSLSRTLKSMEEKGLIERRPNPADGRSVLVFLTEFGIEKRRDAKNAVLTFNNTIFDQLPEQKLHHFFDVLNHINQQINNRKIKFDTYEENNS